MSLGRLGPACIVLCNNTLHKALDALRSTLDLGVPVIHIVRETGERARASGMRKVLLLGTKFTMEDGYYARELERFGLTVSIPEAAERDDIQTIQSELARGRMEPHYREYFDALLRRYAALDAAVLACTARDRTFHRADADPESDAHPVRSGVPVRDRVSTLTSSVSGDEL